MHPTKLFLPLTIAASLGVCTAIPSLAQVCTAAYIQAALPANSFLQGVEPVPSSVNANIVRNFTVNGGGTALSTSNRDFCNVSFTYGRTGRSDKVNLWFYLPSPDQFQNRFLATGGGGLAITSGERGLAGGLVYGAATATTDGGFGGWRNDLSTVLLRADGTLNYDMLFAYGYTAIHEMTVLGKELTRKFYAPYSLPKFYSYYQGCSEGGRQGFSQIQRYGPIFDGVALGAPAFRQAFLQVAHLFPPVVQNTLGYWPSPCELDSINTDTIKACDGLDGLLDGVVSRTDLCKLHHNASASIGTTYNCSASNNRGVPSPAAQGTVTAQAVKIAETIWDGHKDSKGRQVYISTPLSASFADAATTFNPATGKYEAVAGGIGLQYVNLFLKEIRSSTLSLQGVTYDTLRRWILDGMRKFGDTLQTNWPDLEDFRVGGGKIIHWHGEADNGIPAASSLLYHDAVRKTMYPGLGYNESYARLNEWYRLFMVPGAGHCGPNAQQANGPFPQDVLGSVINWVEKGVNPTRLNATVQAGLARGEQQRLCSWPLRPLWKDGALDCVYHQESVDSWLPKLDSIPVPVY
ncbi:Tannase/feruloyl esterase [Lasiosphaeris hirsuta]|uniref:Carboxylic ester hydrolase n=1 Tax=Lasiosphaeris hirsuta TaxID=260670 RepID=A0AA40BDM3_9PEZI|nr:Tannase/feruloyl esterase [Lasiosphaeris hirsuta]